MKSVQKLTLQGTALDPGKQNIKPLIGHTEEDTIFKFYNFPPKNLPALEVFLRLDLILK